MVANYLGIGFLLRHGIDETGRCQVCEGAQWVGLPIVVIMK